VDGLVKVWDAASGLLLFNMAGHKGTVEAIAFSPDGKYIATAISDTSARIWDAIPRGEIRVIHAGGTPLPYYSPDGAKLFSGIVDSAKLWDVASGEELLTLTGHTGFIEAVAFSLDGKFVATGSWDGTAKIWDATTGQILHSLAGHTDQVGQPAFSPNGKQLATAGYDKTVKFWDVATGQELASIDLPNPEHCVDFSPDGTRVAVGGDGPVVVLDITSQQEIFRIPVRTNVVYQVFYSPNGKYLAIASNDTSARVYDAATGEELLAFSGHIGGVGGITWSRDSASIATTSSDSVRIWDVATGTLQHILYGLTRGFSGSSFSPDGTHLVTGGADGTVRVFTLRLEELVALAQSRVTRGLTVEECQQYLHMAVCP
jgi:WD40 repeat protein